MSSEPVDDAALVRAYVDSTSRLLAALDVVQVARVAQALREARRRGATVFVVGNGGSAATASHFVTDLNKLTDRDDAPHIRALSLTDNVPFMSALSNDVDYEHVFSGQLDRLLRPGDVLVAISASGRSPNVLRAVEHARARGLRTIALVGFDGGALLSLAEMAIHVRSEHGAYGPVEDVHHAIQHVLAHCLSRG